MKNRLCLLPLLLVSVSVFSQEIKHTHSQNANSAETDSLFRNMSDSTKTVTLGDIVIKSNNVISKSDRLVLIPTSNMRKASSSAWNLLSKIKLPGVILDLQNKNATTMEGGTVLFKINNIDATINEFLTVAPEDIKKVEYFDKLGARYNDSNISAIINIVTKKHTSGGQFGLYENVAFTTMSLYNSAYVKFNKANSLFSLSYYNKYRDYKKSYTDTYLKTDEMEISRKGVEAPYGYFLQNLDAVYNYQKSNFVFNAKLSYYTNNNNNQDSPQEIFNQGLLIGNSFVSPKDKSYSPILDLFSEYKISKKQSLLFNVVGRYLHTDYNYFYTEKIDETDSRFEYGVEGKRKSLIAEGMYSYSLQNLSWDTGLRYKITDTHNLYSDDISNDFASKDQDLYAYTQVSGNIKRFHYMGGFGVSWVCYKEGDNAYKRVLYRPIGRIKYMPLDNMGLTYQITMRPVIPSLSVLSGISKSLNKYEFDKGNSALRPYDNIKHDFSFSWNPERWYLSLNYNIETARKLFAPGFYSQDGKLGYQYLVFDKKYAQKLGLSASFDIIKDMLSINAYFSYNYYDFDMRDEDFSLSDFAYGGRLSFYYKNFSANIAFNHNPKELFGMKSFYGESTGSIDCSYRYKKVSFSLGLWNPFKKHVNSSGYEYEREGLYKKEYFRIKNNANMVTLGVAFDMNWGESYKTANKRLYNADNGDGIVK